MSLKYRNDEERFFGLWLGKCEELKLVKKGWLYEPESYELIAPETYTRKVHMKTKTVEKEFHLHRSVSYTPDFKFKLTEKGARILGGYFVVPINANEYDNGEIFIDVKGSFSMHHDAKYFSVIQKLFHREYGIWAMKVIPKKLFVQTFAPEEARWKKNGRELNKMGRDTLSAEVFLVKNADLFN